MVEVVVEVGLEVGVEEGDSVEVAAGGLEVVVVVLEIIDRCTYPASVCLTMVTLIVTAVES